ncbi:hypothetical protein EDB84DRAFT_1556599 [Lactarius hengduanensis]|nr:hypothetical protein EDB84DRAFT_1556599 [Lactarius hengduanensis]
MDQAREAPQISDTGPTTKGGMDFTLNMGTKGPPPFYVMPSFYRDTTQTPTVSPSHDQTSNRTQLPILPLPIPDVDMPPAPPVNTSSPPQPTRGVVPPNTPSTPQAGPT